VHLTVCVLPVPHFYEMDLFAGMSV
jgi:hypothetical protein